MNRSACRTLSACHDDRVGTLRREGDARETQDGRPDELASCKTLGNLCTPLSGVHTAPSDLYIIARIARRSALAQGAMHRCERCSS